MIGRSTVEGLRVSRRHQGGATSGWMQPDATLPSRRPFPGIVVLLLASLLAPHTVGQQTVATEKRAQRPDTGSLRRKTVTGSSSLSQQLLEEETPVRTAAPEISPSGGDARSTGGAIAEVAAKMAAVEKQIRAGRLGSRTRDLQAEILLQLEELIDEAQSQTQSGGSSSGQQSLRTGQVSSAQDGEESGSSPQSLDREFFSNGSLNAIWGHLPRNLQQLIRNPLDEDFLPTYRRQIEDYYQRLSERRGARE